MLSKSYKFICLLFVPSQFSNEIEVSQTHDFVCIYFFETLAKTYVFPGIVEKIRQFTMASKIAKVFSAQLRTICLDKCHRIYSLTKSRI